MTGRPADTPELCNGITQSDPPVTLKQVLEQDTRILDALASVAAEVRAIRDQVDDL